MEESVKYVLTPDTANAYQEWEKNLGSEIGQTRKPRKGKGVGSTKVMYIKEINIEYLPTDGVHDDDVTTLDSWELQICTNPQTAMVGLANKSLFAKFRKILHVVGAAFVWADEQPWKVPINKPYVKNEMFIGIDSNGLEAEASFQIEIVYEYKYVNNFIMSRMLKALT